jgi:uncharacterized protein (DUF934 family)
MTHLIHRSGVQQDTWVRFSGDAAQIPAGADVLLPLDEWRERSAVWAARGGRTGVVLSPTDDPFALAGDLHRLSLIAVAFPRFTDGRAYSSARLIRERLGWTGELRAVGDVLRDQLFLMVRCGFSSFALREDQNPVEALASFKAFSVRYQACADEPTPLFRRRRWAEAA